MSQVLSRLRARSRRFLQNVPVYADGLVNLSGHISDSFVLFAQGRTGSTLLGTLLDSHPKVTFEHEILNIDADPTPFVSPYLYSLGRRVRSEASVYGYHVKIYQLSRDHGVDPARYVHRAYADGWKLLYLKRTNLLRHALSNIRAETTRTYHVQADGEAGTDEPPGRGGLHVDPSEIIERMEEREAFLEWESEIVSEIPHLALVYERDLIDPERHRSTAEAAFEYLDLETEDVPVSTSLERINQGRVRDLVRNYEEVVAALSGTRFERFLEC